LEHFPRSGEEEVPALMEAGTDDNERRKDLLVHQYIAREGGSIALADVAWQGELQHYEEQ